jgi:hypothetical protein
MFRDETFRALGCFVMGPVVMGHGVMGNFVMGRFVMGRFECESLENPVNHDSPFYETCSESKERGKITTKGEKVEIFRRYFCIY